MKRLLLPLLLAALPMRAAHVEVGAQHVVVNAMGDTGELTIELSRGFGASAEVFWTDALSTRASATFVNPAAILYPDNPPPDDVDLGTLGMDMYAATMRWNLAPQRRLSGYVGAGGAVVDIGNLDDQFGDAVDVEFDRAFAFAAEAGLRYRWRDHVFFELGATYLPLTAKARTLRNDDPRITVPPEISVDPVVVSAGAAWRF